MPYQDSLVSRWDMSNVNPPDLGFRRLGNDGTGVGLVTATDIVQGIHGKSMATEFDGTEYVTLAAPTSLQIAFPISVAMWVKLAAIGATGGLFENDVAASGYGVGINVSPAGGITLTFFDGSGTGGGSRRVKTGSTSLVAGRWYHVVSVFQGLVDMQIYLDGMDDLGAYGSTGGAIGYSGGDGRIGSRFNVKIDGVIDDVRYYGAALTQLQVMDLMISTRQGRL